MLINRGDMRLLIVDDSSQIVTQLKKKLYRRFVIDHLEDYHQALMEISCSDYQVIITGAPVSKFNTLNLIREIRASEIITPLLVLVKTPNTVNTTQLLDSGADAFIYTPFQQDALLAKLNALIRRQACSNGSNGCKNEILISPFKFDLISNQCSYQDKPLLLQRSQKLLLKCLMRHYPNLVTRCQLRTDVWERAWVERNTIDAQICRLRKRLVQLTGFNPIRTEHCVGYRFVVEGNS